MIEDGKQENMEDASYSSPEGFLLPKEYAGRVLDILKSKATTKKIVKALWPIVEYGYYQNKILFATSVQSANTTKLEKMCRYELAKDAAFRSLGKLQGDYLNLIGNNVYAYFNPETNNIVVGVPDDWILAIEKNGMPKETNELGSFLEYILLHELCHYFDHNNFSSYISLFYGPVLLPFYRELLIEMLKYENKKVDQGVLDILTRSYILSIHDFENMLLMNAPTNRSVIIQTFLKHGAPTTEYANILRQIVTNIGTARKCGRIYINCFDLNNLFIESIGTFQERYCSSEVVAICAEGAWEDDRWTTLYTQMLQQVFRPSNPIPNLIRKNQS